MFKKPKQTGCRNKNLKKKSHWTFFQGFFKSFKELVHTKMKILSVFTQPHVVPTL